MIDLSTQVAELRRLFDESFAAPPPEEATAPVRMLGLRLAGDAYAFRLTEVAALVGDRKIVPVETRIPEVLGLAGLRGTLLPVYDLAALLGYGPLAAPPRWFVSLSGAEPLALAFAQLDGYLETAGDALKPVPRDGARRHVSSLVRLGERTRAVIDTASLVAAIGERAAAKER